MAVDEAGQQRGVRPQVHDGGGLRRVTGDDGGDPAVLDEHHAVVVQVPAVEEARGTDGEHAASVNSFRHTCWRSVMARR
ncbi:hypothetical protein [Nonomuraea wenchangensis]|uniref:hypothetical protein n=1 Tax=Nonomuraea wenchangensis TaxID=568860 RepID=UPI00379F43A8